MTTDVTMQSNATAESVNIKVIHPIEECTAVTGVKTGILTEFPVLETALKQFDHWIEENNLYCFDSDHPTVKWRNSDIHTEPEGSDHLPSTVTPTKMECDENPRSFLLLVDGPYGIRLALHPETTVKSLNLTNYPYFYQFIDIKKSFMKFYELTSVPKTINEMLKYLQIDDEYLPPCSNMQLTEHFLSPSQNDKTECMSAPQISDSQCECQYSNMQIQSPSHTSVHLQDQSNYSDVDESCEQAGNCQQINSKASKPGYWPSQHCRVLVKLAKKMSLDGMKWTEYETVNREYYPAIICKSDIVSDNVVVRAGFFSGINIAKGGISLVLSKIGRRNGEALIRFADSEQQSLALRKHKHHVGKRYIEVYAATGYDFVSVAGGESEEAEKFLEKLTTPSQTLIRMRGLPYTTTTEQIITFFANTDCSVQFGADGILFVNRRDGRATGDAFVIFETKAVAEKALENNKQHIGNRYIELFKSTPAEVNQVMNGILNSTSEEQVQCWNNSTENNNTVFTTSGTAFIPPFNDVNSLVYSNFNLKLLTGQPNIPEFAFSPHIIPLNSHSSYIGELPHCQLLTPQQTLTFGLTANLSQNGSLCLQRLLPSTTTNSMPTASLTTESTINFNSIDFLNTFPGIMNSTAPSILPANQLITDYTRPAALHSTNHLAPTLILPRHPVNSIPVTNALGSTVVTNSINNQFLIPDPSNLQLLQIYGPAVTNTVPSAAAATTATNNSSNNNHNIDNLGLFPNLSNFGLSIGQIAKRFIRIYGMPVNADITDILVFLQDSWRNVAVHGIHLVYDITGQPIGEAMIQFVSELSAQTVCEQKHKSIFIKYGLSIPITTRVDVVQCTIEDLNQLIFNMSRSLGISASLSNMTSSAPSSLINPLTLTPVHTLDESTATHGVFDSIPQTLSPTASQTGFGITRSNFLRICSPEINWNPYVNIKDLNNFNIPPPPLPNPSSYIAGTNNTFSLPTSFNDNITNALVQCTPLLSNILGFHVPNLLYQTTIPNLVTNNSMNIESTGMLSSQFSYLSGNNTINNNMNTSSNNNSLYGSKPNSDWTNSWSNNVNKDAEIIGMPDIYMHKPNDGIPSKMENKPLTVSIKGLPKEMTTTDFNKWLEKKIKDLKIMSIQIEHSSSEPSCGNATLYLQKHSDAELLVREFNNTLLNNFQISAEIN
ncbi:unnamed protein product [Heterobilharzia americana]|nr:unnamed protein product [Heterobilharzia americana]